MAKDSAMQDSYLAQDACWSFNAVFPLTGINPDGPLIVVPAVRGIGAVTREPGIEKPLYCFSISLADQDKP